MPAAVALSVFTSKKESWKKPDTIKVSKEGINNIPNDMAAILADPTSRK
jgi:hypothetical protein